MQRVNCQNNMLQIKYLSVYMRLILKHAKYIDVNKG